MFIDDATQIPKDIKPQDIKSQISFAAQKLEQIFIYELLKALRETHLYDDYPGSGFESQIFWSMWDSEVAEQASKQESLGLAPIICNWLENQLKIQPANTNTHEIERHQSSNSSSIVPKNIGEKISSNFGWRKHPIFGYRHFHTGIDLALPKGFPLKSPISATVEFAGNMKGYGNVVILRTDDKSQVLLAHLDSIAVNTGANIKVGDLLGTVGESGNSTGPHLHLEVRQKGEAVNPLSNAELVSSIEKVLLKFEKAEG